MEGLGGDMEVAAGHAQAPMAQQELDPPQIHPRFEEMRREAVAEGIWGFLPKATKRYIPGLELREGESLATLSLPLLLVFLDDMRVGEIQIDGGGGQPVMPEDFLNRSQ